MSIFNHYERSLEPDTNHYEYINKASKILKDKLAWQEIVEILDELECLYEAVDL